MPIRFRCKHCSQLLGIARRKAGTTVCCPSCQRDVIVPAVDDPALASSAPSSGRQPGAPLFERSDFDIMFSDSSAPKPAREAGRPTPPLPPTPPPTGYDVDPLPSLVLTPHNPGPPPAGGVFLSPTQATVLTVVTILLLALAFGVGLFVGHYWLG